MLNFFNNRQNDNSFTTSYVIENNPLIKSNSEINKYKYTIYQPLASKE